MVALEKSAQKQSEYELSMNRTVTMAVPEGEEKVVVMHCGHRQHVHELCSHQENDIGLDVLAKICSVVQNTLFKSENFSPQPNHADKVVGICLYDCGF